MCSSLTLLITCRCQEGQFYVGQSPYTGEHFYMQFQPTIKGMRSLYTKLDKPKKQIGAGGYFLPGSYPANHL